MNFQLINVVYLISILCRLMRKASEEALHLIPYLGRWANSLNLILYFASLRSSYDSSYSHHLLHAVWALVSHLIISPTSVYETIAFLFYGLNIYFLLSFQFSGSWIRKGYSYVLVFSTVVLLNIYNCVPAYQDFSGVWVKFVGIMYLKI